MITEILTLLGSPVAGGLTALVGNYFTRKEERKLQQLKLDHEFRSEKLRSENARAELSLQGEIKDNELQGEAFVESQKHGTDSLWWVRPIISFYLLALSTYIAYQVNILVGGLDSLPVTSLVELYGQMISAIIYLTITAVTWYYGQRNSKGIQNVFGK